MKHILIVFFLLFVFFFHPFSHLSAQEWQRKEVVLLTKGEVVNENYFAAGESVTLAGTVNGDAYIAGGNIIIEGVVNGDLIAAGGIINMRGRVSQDVRIMGGQINITGNVSGNVTVLGGSVTLADTATIGGSLVAGVGNLSLFAPVGEGATFGAGAVTLGNSIGGNVLAGVGNLTMTPNASVRGNFTYYSEDTANIQQGATISGMIDHKMPPVQEREVTEKVKNVAGFVLGFSFIMKLLSLLSSFIFGLLFLKLFPVFTKQTVEMIQKNPWKSMGIGLSALLLVPLLAIFLFVTVVGIPFALILMIGYFFSLYISKVFVWILLGRKVVGYISKNSSDVIFLLVGLIVYAVLTMIPALGGLVSFISLLVGFGALLLEKKHSYITLKTKKLI